MISHQILCVRPSLAAPLQTLAHRQNLASLSLLYLGITLVDNHLNWMN